MDSSNLLFVQGSAVTQWFHIIIMTYFHSEFYWCYWENCALKDCDVAKLLFSRIYSATIVCWRGRGGSCPKTFRNPLLNLLVYINKMKLCKSSTLLELPNFRKKSNTFWRYFVKNRYSTNGARCVLSGFRNFCNSH